jgi:hypothetical protein
MEFIERVSTSGNASVTFTSGGVWADYQDLVLFVKWRSDSGAGYAGGYLYPNGSSSNLSGRAMYSVGSNPIAGSSTNGVVAYLPTQLNDANLFASGYIRLFNINDTSNPLIFGSRVFASNSTNNYDMFEISVHKWSQNTALTSFQLSATGGIADNSTFSLYGLRSGSGGGTITLT